MNELKNVLKHLNKEEVNLSSEKVELGLLQDIEKEMEKANKGAIAAIDAMEKAKKPAEQSLELNKKLLKKITDTAKKASELGAKDAVGILGKQSVKVSANIKAIEKIIKALNSY